MASTSLKMAGFRSQIAMLLSSLSSMRAGAASIPQAKRNAKKMRDFMLAAYLVLDAVVETLGSIDTGPRSMTKLEQLEHFLT